jgi:hypothetical protein
MRNVEGKYPILEEISQLFWPKLRDLKRICPWLNEIMRTEDIPAEHFRRQLRQGRSLWRWSRHPGSPSCKGWLPKSWFFGDNENKFSYFFVFWREQENIIVDAAVSSQQMSDVFSICENFNFVLWELSYKYIKFS